MFIPIGTLAASSLEHSKLNGSFRGCAGGLAAVACHPDATRLDASRTAWRRDGSRLGEAGRSARGIGLGARGSVWFAGPLVLLGRGKCRVTAGA